MRGNVHDWKQIHSEFLRFVGRRVSDHDVAKDIVQEVMIKIFSKSAQVREGTSFRAWTFAILRNAIADHYRRLNRPDFTPVPESESGEKDFNACVANCLMVLVPSLPEKYRIALQLTEIENRSQLDVAALLGISHAGARSRVQRARHMLRKKMDELFIIQTDPYGNVIVCENRVQCCSCG